MVERRALIPLVRQDRKGVELDPLLVQLLGFLGRSLAVDRAVVDLAIMHLAGFLGKLLPDIVRVFGEMLAQILELLAQLLLLRRHHGDRGRLGRGGWSWMLAGGGRRRLPALA